MLPLKLELQGFVCYRDQTVFDFSDASLWMLCGRNGAGKSTVFDAMRFALFGVHRGGLQGAEALIHHDASEARVSFEFETDKVVRVTRTLRKRGNASWQIQVKNGENWDAVPGTESSTGYKEWIRKNLGLSDQSFVSTMYLAQGRADEILSADLTKRYQILSEIIDLSPIQRLHEAAEDEQKIARRNAKDAEQSVENAPVPDLEALEALRENLVQLENELREIQPEIERLEKLEPLSEQWSKWQNDIAQKQNELAKLSTVSSDIAALQGQSARLEWLEKAVPLASHETEKSKAQTALSDAETRHQSAVLALEKARESWQNARELLENSRANREDLRKERDAAQDQKDKFSPLVRSFGDWRAACERLDERRAELREFPENLAAQIKDVRAEIARARQAKVSAPLWEKLVAEIEKIAEIEPQIAAKTREIEGLAQQIGALETENERANASQREAESAENTARDALTTRSTQLDAARESVARFEQVAGESECHFCGQKLTPAHRESEEKRLQNVLNEARKLEAQARSEWESQSEKLRQSREETARLQREIEARKDVQRSAQKDAEQAQKEVRNAENARQNLRGELSENGAHFDENFEQNALELSRRELETQTAIAAHLGELEDKAKKLSDLSEGQKTAQIRLDEAQKQADAAHTKIAGFEENQTRAAWETANSQIENLNSQIKKLDTKIDELEPQTKKLEKEKDNLSQQQRELEDEKSKLTQQIALLNVQIENLRANFVDLNSDEKDWQTQLPVWREELERLQSENPRQKLTDFETARAEIEKLEQNIQFLSEQCEKLVPEARRAPDELQTQIEELRKKEALLSGEIGDNKLQIRKLNEQLEERKKLESSLLEAQSAFNDWKDLTELLGPKKLQRFLLASAEREIIGFANEILDRLSAGSLALELRDETTEVSGSSRGEGALNFVVFQESNSHARQAVFPEFLSGSQRFRVAVALALGIGRYATRGQSNGMDCVMIDEGFGSLDKFGLDDMKSELRALGQQLRRVILVSHQDDFAQAFPHRYVIESDGRNSTARVEIN